jgi:hypothetical protein
MVALSFVIMEQQQRHKSLKTNAHVKAKFEDSERERESEVDLFHFLPCT